MISVNIGNLFEGKTGAIVNTINCAGVMGKGIALDFKKRYPAMFADYVKRCESGQVKLGKPYLYKDLSGVLIVNFPTKKHWRSPAKLSDIVNGLEEFKKKYQEWGVESIAFPPLGCGNGGLDWSVVGPVMYQMLSSLNIAVEIYAPYGTPKQQLSESFLSKKEVSSGFTSGRIYKRMQPGWLPLLEVINQLEKQTYACPIGRTIFQKICYVLTELGVNTGFEFTQSSYGPFSKNIKEAITIFANENLIYETQMGKMTAIKIGEAYNALRHNHLENLKIYQKKIDKTVDLFSRIKSTIQAEEVATVLYAARDLKKNKDNIDISEQDLYEYILNWKKTWNTKEKQQAVILTIRNLQILSWLKLKYSESLSQGIEG